MTRHPSRPQRPPAPANDNAQRPAGLKAKVLIPKDLPVTQDEIEVFAVLLDDWLAIPANDNEGPDT